MGDGGTIVSSSLGRSPAGEHLEVSALRVVRSGRVVLSDAAFIARAGRVLGILGPNGAGKSSLLKAVVGVLPYEGEVRVGGTSVGSLDRTERARRVAYVPQQSELRSPLTVREVVLQGRYPHRLGVGRPTATDHDETERALSLVDATALAGRAFTALSQGERQRVLVARALATGARVLLLDEPTSALDVGHALRLHRLLRDLAQLGYCVVAVLHPLERALEWTDDALLLEEGRTLAFGESRHVICAGPIERVYGVRLVPEGALGFQLPAGASTADTP
jgi:iron complex transport system ATP-binding protein